MPRSTTGSLMDHAINEAAEIAGMQGVGEGLPPSSLEPTFGDGSPPPEDPRPSAGPLVSNAYLGMLIFMGAEAMFFAGLIGAFLVFRLGSVTWPPPFQPRLPVMITGINSVILLVSAYTMHRALRAIRRGNQAGLVKGLLLTALLGLLFLGVQGSEWIRLVHFGLTLASGSYGATFYTLIGIHGFHVLGAVVWLLILSILSRHRRFSASNHGAVQLCGMYWYFVVGLWPILYTLVYLS
ncbi:MAG: heme-copper oxidase subunit III [candidate division NC10 bacterium]|nr:heme-copper oxidase subunit III [candidate division NC10 bacterium]